MAMQVIGLFCEDIREEKNGQVSLVGIMPDNANIPSPPTSPPKNENTILQGMLPKLALYVRVHLALEDDPGPMQISLIFPNGEAAVLTTISEDIIETSKKEAKAKDLPIAGIFSHMVFIGFRVPGSGKLVAVLDSKYGRQTCAVLNLITPELN
jgi:hypothetical protein